MRSKTTVALRKYGLCRRPLLKGKQSSLTHKHHSLSKSWEQQSTECKGTIWNRLETMLTISQVCFLNEIQLVEAWYLHQEFLSSTSEAFLVIHREKHCMSLISGSMILASGIPKFCIRGLLGDTQRKTLYEFCNVISLLAAEGVNVSELDSLECRVHRVLSLLERDIPVSLHVVFHLLHHLPMFIQRYYVYQKATSVM